MNTLANHCSQLGTVDISNHLQAVVMVPSVRSLPSSGSGSCSASFPHNFEAAGAAGHCAAAWYQHIDDLAFMEDLDSGPDSISSILSAVVPDATACQHQQQLDSQAAAPAAGDHHLLALLATAEASAAAEAGSYWDPCSMPMYPRSQGHQDMVVPVSTTASEADMQCCPEAWQAADPELTGAAGYFLMNLGKADTVISGPQTAANSPSPYSLTRADAGSSSSPAASKSLSNLATTEPTAATSTTLPAPVLATHGSSASPAAAKPAAAAAASGDNLAIRREANKFSQRRQRYKRQQDMEQLKAQLSDMADKQTATKQQLDSLRSENVTLLSRLSDVTAKWQATVALNASLQQENTTHKAEIADLQQQLVRVQAQLQQQQWAQMKASSSAGMCWQQQQQAALWS